MARLLIQILAVSAGISVHGCAIIGLKGLSLRSRTVGWMMASECNHVKERICRVRQDGALAASLFCVSSSVL